MSTVINMSAPVTSDELTSVHGPSITVLPASESCDMKQMHAKPSHRPFLRYKNSSSRILLRVHGC